MVLSDFTQQHVKELEHLGDTSILSGSHEEAIEHYSAALLLNPPIPQQLLIKRSKAQIAKGMWKDALHDANEVNIFSCVFLHSSEWCFSSVDQTKLCKPLGV